MGKVRIIQSAEGGERGGGKGNTSLELESRVGCWGEGAVRRGFGRSEWILNSLAVCQIEHAEYQGYQ